MALRFARDEPSLLSSSFEKVRVPRLRLSGPRLRTPAWARAPRSLRGGWLGAAVSQLPALRSVCINVCAFAVWTTFLRGPGGANELRPMINFPLALRLSFSVCFDGEHIRGAPCCHARSGIP